MYLYILKMVKCILELKINYLFYVIWKVYFDNWVKLFGFLNILRLDYVIGWV